MPMPDQTTQLTPLPLPEDAMQRAVLVAIRRMAAFGVRDAQAALLALQAFGLGYRQPLVLLRAFVVELAHASQRRITVAPCCARRMTLDEGRMVGVLATAACHPGNAARHLDLLTGGAADSSAALSVAAAFGGALAEMGKPLVL